MSVRAPLISVQLISGLHWRTFLLNRNQKSKNKMRLLTLHSNSIGVNAVLVKGAGLTFLETTQTSSSGSFPYTALQHVLCLIYG